MHFPCTPCHRNRRDAVPQLPGAATDVGRELCSFDLCTDVSLSNCFLCPVFLFMDEMEIPRSVVLSTATVDMPRVAWNLALTSLNVKRKSVGSLSACRKGQILRVTCCNPNLKQTFFFVNVRFDFNLSCTKTTFSPRRCKP